MGSGYLRPVQFLDHLTVIIMIIIWYLGIQEKVISSVGNCFTSDCPLVPCWTNSTWSREIQFKLLKKSLLQRKEILMWRSNLLKSLPELSQVASSALPEEKFILLRATKFYLLPPSTCIKLAKIKFVAMYIWHNLKMFQISQFCEIMFEASGAN